MNEKLMPMLIATSLLTTACATTNDIDSNTTRKQKSNVVFKDEATKPVDIVSLMNEGAKTTERQFQLLEQLTYANRTGETRNSLYLSEGLPADVRMQSKYHPRETLSQQQTFKMMKEGDTGQNIPKDYAKVLPTSVSVEPIPKPVVDTHVPTQNYTINNNQKVMPKMSVEQAMQRYAGKGSQVATNKKPVKINNHLAMDNTTMSNKTFSNPAHKPLSNVAPVKLNTQVNGTYVGNPNNVPKSYATYSEQGNSEISKKIAQYSNVSNNNAQTHKANVANIKKDVHDSNYKDFLNKQLTGVIGEYAVSDLLTKIAQKTGYQLNIEGNLEKGKSLKINTGNQFKGTSYDALMGVTTALKSKNAGKVFINPKNKTIRVVFN